MKKKEKKNIPLDEIKLRNPTLGQPKHMSDGLSASVPADFDTNHFNCNDHARRKFYEIEDSFAEEVGHVLEIYKRIYHKDSLTKEMTAKERLDFHKEETTPIVKELHDWMEKAMGEGWVEPNSALGGAIKYKQKRWEKLTAFLRGEGAPLSNIECEQKIKSIIPHRKGSLFFKNSRGAFVGDVMMSVLQTCETEKTSPIDYLDAICANHEQVVADPGAWLLGIIRPILRRTDSFRSLNNHRQRQKAASEHGGTKILK